MMRDILIAFYLKYDGDFKRMCLALALKEQIDTDEWLWGIDPYDFITIIDKDYPVDKYGSIPNPPFVLLRKDEVSVEN